MASTSRFVFISYAREDGAPFAARLSADLTRAGHQPWRDTERLTTRGGEAWERELLEQLLSAELVVIVMTPGAVASPFVRGEFTKALENNLTIVPALFADCDMPLGLVELQYVDFRTDAAAGLAHLLTKIDSLNDPAAEVERNRETLRRLTANRDRAARQGRPTPALDARIEAVRNRLEAFTVDVDAQTSRVHQGLEEEKQRAAAEAARPSGPGVRRYGRRPPTALGDTFYDRVDQQDAIRAALLDPRSRMVTVLGRGGMGKTALACCVLSTLEQTATHKALGDGGLVGVAYLQHTPTQPITLDRALLYIARVLPDEAAEKAERVFGNRDLSTDDRVDRFLELMPDGLVIALFDNFEDLLDERGRIRDADLNLFVRRVLTGQGALRLLVTARAAINLPAVELRGERQVTLRDGLPDADAMALLRELDPNDEIGLAGAADADLLALVQRTYGIPRALELVANMLKGDDDTGLLQGLDEVANEFWSRETVVENLVEENYRRLRPEARRVAEALALFSRPVPQVAVDFLLQPHVPGLRLAEVLQPLVNARLVSVERGRDGQPARLGLHRIDRDFLYQRLPADGPYSRSVLHLRAAEFYRTQRMVGPTGWRSLTELQPQVFEYEHLVMAGEFDAAALLLGEYAGAIAHCGHPTHCRDLFLKLPDQLSSDRARVAHGLTALIWKAYLGPIDDGLKKGEQALQLAIASGARAQELQVRRELVTAYRYASDGVRSREHAEHLGALLASDVERDGSDDLTWFDLVLAYTYLGDVRRAAPLARQGYEVARRSGKPFLVAMALNGLAVLYFAWGRHADAVRVGGEAEAIWRPGFNDGIAYVQNIVGMSQYLLGDYPAAVAK
ncbi:MAG: TIR domain-containing protein, partial [Vicinamibacterales bacterium]